MGKLHFGVGRMSAGMEFLPYSVVVNMRIIRYNGNCSESAVIKFVLMADVA